MSLVSEVGRDDFESRVLDSQKPVLVDFWAPWCGPCRQVAPQLERLAANRAEALDVVKVNVDDNQDLAMRYQISSIPTFILFKDGEPSERLSGAMPLSAFEAMVDRNVAVTA